MTMNAESQRIAVDLISVKYRNADPLALLARCDAWLAKREAEEWRIRDGRSMVAGQLDLLDISSRRVEAVRINCQRIAAERTPLAA